MKATVRRRILDHITREAGRSAAQIGRSLNLSAAAVRHHLAVLLSDGRIVMTGQTRGRGRGRPVKSYRASDHLLGDNTAAIVDTLLDAWPSGSGSAGPNGLATTLAQGLSQRLVTSASPRAVSKRIAGLIKALNAAHYHARWEAGADGPRILLGHCPYYAIVSQHPVLCQMDALVLEAQLEAKATQVAKIDPTASAVTQCIFLVK